MAYPDRIKETGALSQVGDIFEYFKGAFLDNLVANPEDWNVYDPSGVLIDGILYSWTYLGSNPNNRIGFPMTRGQFYDWIDYWTITTNSSNSWVNDSYNMFITIHGTKLYQFSEPQGNTDWPIEAVNHWGKIKTLELAIFGSVGNGGDLSANSLFTSGSVESRVTEFKISSLSYLRYALSRFDSYGSCHPDYVEGPALTIGTQSITPLRLLSWTNPSGVLNGDCEYSLDFEKNYHPVTNNPITIPSGRHEIGQISVRVRKSRDSYVEEGPSIFNTIVYP